MQKWEKINIAGFILLKFLLGGYKVLGRAILMIMLILIISTFGIVLVAFIQEGVGEELLGQIDNASKLVLTNATHQAAITDRKNDYESVKIDYDTIAIVIFITLELTAITLAILSPKIPNLSFLTFLFFGSALLLFIFTIIIQLNRYLYEELLIGIFPSVVFTMPFYNYLLGNPYFLLGSNIVILLLINRFFGREELDEANISGGALS